MFQYSRGNKVDGLTVWSDVAISKESEQVRVLLEVVRWRFHNDSVRYDFDLLAIQS
jgi:hypothetical protein